MIELSQELVTGIAEVQTFGDRWDILVRDPQSATIQVRDALSDFSIDRIQTTEATLEVDRNQQASDVLKAHLESWRVAIFGDRLHVILDRLDTEIPHLQAVLATAGIGVRSIRPVPFSLEDASIGVVQRSGTGHAAEWYKVSTIAMVREKEKGTILQVYASNLSVEELILGIIAI